MKVLLRILSISVLYIDRCPYWRSLLILFISREYPLVMDRPPGKPSWPRWSTVLIIISTVPRQHHQHWPPMREFSEVKVVNTKNGSSFINQNYINWPFVWCWNWVWVCYKFNKNKGAKLKSNVKNWCCVFRINKQQIIFMLGRDAKNLRTNLNANLVSLRPIIDFDKCVGEVSAKLHLYCYK